MYVFVDLGITILNGERDERMTLSPLGLALLAQFPIKSTGLLVFDDLLRRFRSHTLCRVLTMISRSSSNTEANFLPQFLRFIQKHALAVISKQKRFIAILLCNVSLHQGVLRRVLTVPKT